MANARQKEAARRQRLKSSAGFISLASISILLVLAVLLSAVWRAFDDQELPPTPTIPPEVEPEFAYVSALSGQVELVTTEREAPRTLRQGHTIEAGQEARIRVPAEGWLRLGFVHGATVYLGAQSELLLHQIADGDRGEQETILELQDGRLLASSGSSPLPLVVQAPNGAEARISGDALAGVIYDPAANWLEAHCLEGACRLTAPSQPPETVDPGSYRRTRRDQTLSAARPLRYELFSALGDPGMVPTPTPLARTTTPAPTPTQATPATATATAPPPTPTPSPTPTATPAPIALSVAAGVPVELVGEAQALAALRPATFTWTDNPAAAQVILTVGEGAPLATWVYAVAAPFPTITDTLTLPALAARWQADGGPPLLVSEPVSATLSTLWDPPGPNVRLQAADKVADALWEAERALAILPFAHLEPRLKVLALAGETPASAPHSPLDLAFDAEAYPLALTIGAVGEEAAVAQLLAAWDGPATNRRPERLTRVAMTGPSGLGRTVAKRIDRYGPEYPGEAVAPLLRAVDVAHLSNEVAFAPDCPDWQPAGVTTFCAPPPYVELMEYVGTDVNEMTGNHVNDWGEHNLQFTLDLYDEVGIETFGGGRDLEAAREPLLLEHNGNRIAFVGCNPVGPFKAWARRDYGGANPCDYGFPEFREQVAALKEEGYLVIATLQYLENYSYAPAGQQARHFHQLAEAGADAVSGSQGHHAQGFAFSEEGAFIHYGLGNLFFDQMDQLATRQSFIDVYTFYEGRLLAVELWTGIIEDYARPRPATPAERAALLEAAFWGSDWNEEERERGRATQN